MQNPRVTDNDRNEIAVSLYGKELRGWSYTNDDERRKKMLAAHEFAEGWVRGLAHIKQRIDTSLNDILCEMKEGYNDSIVGFNEAWDTVRKLFSENEPATETRQQREARWREDHQWDGPLVCIGTVDVPTCSKCGVDASEQRPCNPSERIVGKIANIKAHIECGGCGKPFVVEMDPANMIPDNWTLFDEAVDCVRGGLTRDGGLSSVQGGYLLCGTCTHKIDDAVTEDRNATAEECAKVFGS